MITFLSIFFYYYIMNQRTKQFIKYFIFILIPIAIINAILVGQLDYYAPELSEPKQIGNSVIYISVQTIITIIMIAIIYFLFKQVVLSKKRQ